MLKMVTITDPDFKHFITQNTHEQRQKIAAKALSLYPDRALVVLTRGSLSNTPRITKSKFLVPREATMAKFISEARKQMPGLNHSTGLFFYVKGNKLVQISELIGNIYDRDKHTDGFLYITYTGENVFG